MPCRILYFRGGILEETEDFAPEDLFEAARVASSTHPHLTTESCRKLLFDCRSKLAANHNVPEPAREEGEESLP